MAPVVGLAPTRTGLKGEALGSLHSRAFEKWRNAEGMLPIRHRRTISLAKNPGSLVRFTFHWCPRQDLHLHWSAFEADVSALDYTGEMLLLPVGFAPTLDRV